MYGKACTVKAHYKELNDDDKVIKTDKGIEWDVIRCRSHPPDALSSDNRPPWTNSF